MGTKVELYDFEDKVKNAVVSVMNIEQAKEKKLGLVIDEIDQKTGAGAVKISALEKSLAGISDDETRDEIYTYDTTYTDNIIKEEVKAQDGTVLRTTDYTYSNPAEGVIGGSVKKYKNEKNEQVTVTKTFTYNAAGSITKVATVKTVTPVTP